MQTLGGISFSGGFGFIPPPEGPTAPTALSATSGPGQLTISFTPGADNGNPITNYKYSLDGVTYTALSPADATSPVTITGLNNGTTYTVYLKAVNSVGDSPASASTSGTPATTPAAPTNLVTTIGNTQLSIAFTPGNDGGSAITNYKYSLDGTNYTAFSPADTTSPVVITGLTNGTAYTVYLKAVNAVGDGTASASTTGTPATTPAAPTGLSTTAGDSQLSVAFTPGSDGGSAITNYKYSLDGTNYTAFSPVNTTSPVVITGLTNGTAYTVYLKAVNALGDGAASSGVAGTPVSAAIPPSTSNFSGIANFSYSNKSYEGPTSSNYAPAYSEDGTKLYYNSSGDIRQYTLSTPFDVSTATDSGKIFNHSGTNSYGFDFSNDGTKLFLCSRSYGTMRQYALSTPWDISTASYVKQSGSLSAGTLQDIAVSPDGSAIFYIAGSIVYKLVLSTPWDVAGSSTSATSFNPGGAGAIGLAITRTGTKLLMVMNSSNAIREYTLGSAFDLSSATLVTTFNPPGGSTPGSTYSIYLGKQDTRLITSGSQGRTSYMFSQSGT